MEKVKKIFKHLLMISLVTISLVTIFIIIGSMLFIFKIEIKFPYTDYVFTFYMDHLIHSYIISLFLFSSILYFFYIKNKLKWLLGSVAVIYAIPIIWAGIIYFYDTVYSSRLPDQYNEYQDIENSVLELKNKEIILLAEGYADLNQYLSPQNNLTVRFEDTIQGSEILSIYYKFDSKGNLIAKFYPSRKTEEILLRGYLINADEEYYRSWAFDDDTLKRKIKIYNKEFRLDLKKQNVFLTDIEKKADFIFSKDCYIPGENSRSFRKVIYLKDNKWNAFYYDDGDGISHRSIEYKGEGYNDLFSPHLRLRPPYDSDSDIDRWDLSNSSKNIQSQYFQKIKRYDGGYGEPWYSVYGLDSEPKYDGYLYTNVIVDKDTLKIKELLSIDSKDVIKYHPFSERDEKLHYLYYSNPNLEYQLLTNRSEKLYMIKNKIKWKK